MCIHRPRACTGTTPGGASANSQRRQIGVHGERRDIEQRVTEKLARVRVQRNGQRFARVPPRSA